MTDQPEQPAQTTAEERRVRYAAAMAKRDGHEWPPEYEDDERDYLRRADAATAVADAERRELRADRDNLRVMYRVSEERVHDLIEERDRLRAQLDMLREVSRQQNVRLRAELETARASTLTEADRQFLSFALDLAFDAMVSGDGFTDEDEAALEKLRQLAAEEQPAAVQPAPAAACPWLSGDAIPACDFDPACPVHGGQS